LPGALLPRGHVGQGRRKILPAPLKSWANLPIGSAEDPQVEITTDYVQRILALTRELALARSAAEGLPFTRDRQIEELAIRVRRGCYYVAADAVAERMLQQARLRPAARECAVSATSCHLVAEN